jgi:hypothetical protein
MAVAHPVEAASVLEYVCSCIRQTIDPIQGFFPNTVESAHLDRSRYEKGGWPGYINIYSKKGIPEDYNDTCSNPV